MMRLARWHPFLVLGAMTLIIPLAWRLSGIDYDDGALGLALFGCSYVLLWPAMAIANALRIVPALRSASWLFVPSLVFVLASYVGLDRAMSRRWKSSAPAA